MYQTHPMCALHAGICGLLAQFTHCSCSASKLAAAIILTPSHPFQPAPLLGKDQGPAQLLCIIPSKIWQKLSVFSSKTAGIPCQAGGSNTSTHHSVSSRSLYRVSARCQGVLLGKRPPALQLIFRNRFRKHGKQYAKARLHHSTVQTFQGS